jgi:hypothetical protein
MVGECSQQAASQGRFGFWGVGSDAGHWLDDPFEQQSLPHDWPAQHFDGVGID